MQIRRQRGRNLVDSRVAYPPDAQIYCPSPGPSSLDVLRRSQVAKAENRPGVTLACEDCKRRNYQTQKNKQNDRDRISFKKYCRWCGHHTLHRETR